MPLKLKLDDSGNVVVKDGNPVFIHDDGKEIPFDANGTLATISRLNGEAKGHRERAEAAEAKGKVYEGIDADAARKAIETVGKLDMKKLLDAGEVDKVRDAAKRAFDDQVRSIEEKFAPIVKERDTLQAALVTEKVGGAFARSKFIAEKLAIPPDIVQARFGDSFKLEGDSIVAYDRSGNKIYSRAKPGEIAGFEEAIEIQVDSYADKERILKGSGASGGGASGAGGAGGKRTLTRAQFAALDPAAQAATAKEAGAGSVALVD